MRLFLSSVVSLVSKTLGKRVTIITPRSDNFSNNRVEKFSKVGQDLSRSLLILSSKRLQSYAFSSEAANSFCEKEASDATSKKEVDKKGSSKSNKVQKSWVTSIISDRKNIDEGENKVKPIPHHFLSRSGPIKQGSYLSEGTAGSDSEGLSSVSKTSQGKKPQGVYRRRMSDSTWTSVPMDDKLIWVDCEMTGLNTDSDMIMEIGIVITGPDLEEIAMQPSIIIKVPEENLARMDAWCIKHHGDSGLTEACRKSSRTSEEVDEQILKFVEKYTTPKECPMAGNTIYMDRMFISKQFPKFYSHFHYRSVDVSTIKELVRRWYPEEFSKCPKKKFSHRVIDDIYDSIDELKYYKTAVFRDSVDPSENSQKSIDSQ